MRTIEEINRALYEMKGVTAAAANDHNDDGTTRAAAMVVLALEWVLGDNKPGGFGTLLRTFGVIDSLDAAAKRTH